MRGMSQSGLADRAGTEPNSISRWETGRIKPSAASLRSLALALDVPVGYLVGDLPKGSIVEHNSEKNSASENSPPLMKIVIERGEGESKMRVEYFYNGNLDDETLASIKKIFDWHVSKPTCE